jgi:hypothetical protein
MFIPDNEPFCSRRFTQSKTEQSLVLFLTLPNQMRRKLRKLPTLQLFNPDSLKISRQNRSGRPIILERPLIQLWFLVTIDAKGQSKKQRTQ